MVATFSITVLCFQEHSRIVPKKKDFFSLLPVHPTMDSQPAAPGQFTVKADEKIAFSAPHGLVDARVGKSAEVADVSWNIRCRSIRYNSSRWKGVCQAINSDLLSPKQINMSRLCK